MNKIIIITGLPSLAMLLLVASIIILSPRAYGQGTSIEELIQERAREQASQQPHQQQQQPLPTTTATDGGLSASVAKSNYSAGDTVVINGTVAKYTSSSSAVVEVMDPKGRMVEDGHPSISPVGTFRFTFTAGENVQFDPNHWMLLSGEYKVVVRYTPPFVGTLPERERVELYFNYNNGTATAATTTIQEQLPPPPPQQQNMTTPPQQQLEQQPLSSSPLSQQLQLQQEEEDEAAAGGGGGGNSGTNTGSSTSSSSSSPSSSGGSRCPDGYHRSPSGDCERVTDTRGMPRCPDGYHRSPSGNCEYVG